MSDVPEPKCPAGRRPHRDRIADIIKLCPTGGKTAGVVVDNTPEHIAYYLAELAKHPEISILFQGKLTDESYLIKITKTHQN